MVDAPGMEEGTVAQHRAGAGQRHFAISIAMLLSPGEDWVTLHKVPTNLVQDPSHLPLPSLSDKGFKEIKCSLVNCPTCYLPLTAAILGSNKLLCRVPFQKGKEDEEGKGEEAQQLRGHEGKRMKKADIRERGWGHTTFSVLQLVERERLIK